MSLVIEKYSDNAIIVSSNVPEGTKPYKDFLIEIGGLYNPNIISKTTGQKAAYVYSIKRYNEVLDVVNKINSGIILPNPVVTYKKLATPVLSPLPSFAKPIIQLPIITERDLYQTHCIRLIKPSLNEILKLKYGDNTWNMTVTEVVYLNNNPNDNVTSFKIRYGNEDPYNIIIRDGKWQIDNVVENHDISR